MESHRKNLLLEEELKRLNPSEGGDKLSYDLSLNLRLRLSEAEEEASKLKRKLAETEIALEQANNELLIAKTDLSMVGKDQLEAIELVKQETTKLNEKFISEKQEISEKCEKLEEEARKQMQFVNQLLMDKDSLKTQSLQQKDMLLENEKTIGQLKATLTTLENQGPTGADKDELSKVKEMLVAETNRNMELREENVRLKGLEENLNLKISLLTEQIKSSERQAKDTSHAGQVTNYIIFS
ncbi:hypothetical protein K502DRAFT_234115 [Neoconidiobolus thromboides FSU 785]|nr:hypothetical protein K502DRAFT_234115 [Neoconidiobolus thromboides FSU 785]